MMNMVLMGERAAVADIIKREDTLILMVEKAEMVNLEVEVEVTVVLHLETKRLVRLVQVEMVELMVEAEEVVDFKIRLHQAVRLELMVEKEGLVDKTARLELIRVEYLDYCLLVQVKAGHVVLKPVVEVAEVDMEEMVEMETLMVRVEVEVAMEQMVEIQVQVPLAQVEVVAMEEMEEMVIMLQAEVEDMENIHLLLCKMLDIVEKDMVLVQVVVLILLAIMVLMDAL